MCVCARARTRFKCAHSSDASRGHLVSRDVSPLNGSLLIEVEEKHKRINHTIIQISTVTSNVKGDRISTILSARLRASVTFFRATLNFVLKSALLSIPSADGESLKGEDKQASRRKGEGAQLRGRKLKCLLGKQQTLKTSYTALYAFLAACSRA